MTLSIRRLGPDDVRILDRLAEEDADFDIDGRGGGEDRLSDDDLRAFLSDPTVLFWTASQPNEKNESEVVGFLHCQTIRKYGSRPMEVMLYAIGVRASARRTGVGRALTDTMTGWMKEHDIDEVWVLGDNPGAVAFYEALDFERHPPDDAVYLTRRL